MKTGNRMLSDRELSDFCRQLAMILNAGISLTEGLDMIQEDSPSQEEQQVLCALKDNLEQTGSFCDSLEESHFFPDYMVQMVRIGEQTGHLDDVMISLGEHYDRSDAVHQSIRSAVFYPAMMLCMMVLIIVVLLTKVMPIFNQVFLQLGAELTGISRALLNLGGAIRNSAVVLVAVAVVLVLGGVFIACNKTTRAGAIRFFSKISWVRQLYDTLFLFRFSSGMSMALSSGMDPEYALDMVRNLTDDPLSLERLDQCKESLGEGNDFSQALCSAKIFSGTYGRMTAIGQKTGTMEQVMQQIAQSSQEEFDQKISRLLGMIEPTLVVVLSVIVGVILMSVMFPLLGILSGM